MTPPVRSEEIYEAALDLEALDRLPKLLAAACNGRSSVVSWFSPDGAPQLLNYSHFSAEMMDEYVNTFVKDDLWAKVAFSPRFLNDVTMGDVVVSDDEFDRSIIFNEFFRRHRDDTFYCLGGAQQTQWGTALVGIHRSRRAGSFDDAERSQLRSLVRHLRSALSLRGQLANEQHRVRTGQAALDAMSQVCFVVKGDGRIVLHNEAAETVVRRGDVFKATGKVLRTAIDEHQARLSRAFRQATLSQEPSASSLRFETMAGVTYLVSVTPMSMRSGPSLALVVCKDPLAPAETLQAQLQSFWGLTPHESFVAADLAKGRSIAEIAASRGVQESTVKSQLKSISVKIGGRGQADLISKMRLLP